MLIDEVSRKGLRSAGTNALLAENELHVITARTVSESKGLMANIEWADKRRKNEGE